MTQNLISTFKKIYVLWLLALNSLWSQSSEVFIEGKIISAHTKDPIWLASVALPSRNDGTVTDTLGLFSIPVNKVSSKDTLVVTYLGYKEIRIPLSPRNSFLEIVLQENSVQLESIEVIELSPLYYLNQALKNAHENYKQEPYNIISFVESKIYEGKDFLSGTQSVFKSYHYQQHLIKNFKQQHQIMLYRKLKSTHHLKFMMEKIMKTLKKEQNEKKGDYDPDFQIRLTPDFIPITDDILPFINKKYYKKFTYTLQETCSKRNLIIIGFQTKRWISDKYSKYRGSGTIYINCENYAIAKININAEAKLSFLAKSALFITMNKLIIDEAKISGHIEYKAIDNMWYPHKFSFYAEVKATKINWFSKNKKGNFNLQTNVLVNQIIHDNVQEIPKEKRFSFSKLNLHNDMGIKWEEIRRLRQ